jgi:hypothetical protein
MVRPFYLIIAIATMSIAVTASLQHYKRSNLPASPACLLLGSTIVLFGDCDGGLHETPISHPSKALRTSDDPTNANALRP